MSTPELPPLTDDQRSAIREARFCATSLDRTTSFCVTTDPEVARRLPGSGSSYWRSRQPEVREWDVRIVHPEGVALVLEIQEARGAAA